MSLEDKAKTFGSHHSELAASSNKDKEASSSSSPSPSFTKRLAMFDLLQFNLDFKPNILVKYTFKGKESVVNSKKNKESAKTQNGMQGRLKFGSESQLARV